MSATLFTEDFLHRGLPESPAWRLQELEGLEARFRDILAAVKKLEVLSEEETKKRVIEPMLDALGWASAYTVQQKLDSHGRKNVPDYGFYPDAESFGLADGQEDSEARLVHAVAIGDAKAWSVEFDARESGAAPGETAAGQALHAFALDEGRKWEARVRESLSQVVFSDVFPGLVRGLAAADKQAPKLYDRAYFDELREAALAMLYRLLFALYAEDRGLLPAQLLQYKPYSLSALRDEIAERIDAGEEFTAKGALQWRKCANLFRFIDEGDQSLGVPEYNGGLFSKDRAPLRRLRRRLPHRRADHLVFQGARGGRPGRRGAGGAGHPLRQARVRRVRCDVARGPGSLAFEGS